MNSQQKPEAARVYTYPSIQAASEAKARILAYGLDAFILPAHQGRARLAVILPQGGR